MRGVVVEDREPLGLRAVGEGQRVADRRVPPAARARVLLGRVLPVVDEQ